MNQFCEDCMKKCSLCYHPVKFEKCDSKIIKEEKLKYNKGVEC